MENENQRQNFSGEANLPTVENLLKRTSRVYKERLIVFWKIMAVSFLAHFFIFILPLFLPDRIFVTHRILVYCFLFAWIMIWFFIIFWTQVSLICAVKGRESGFGAEESFRRGWHKIIPYILVSVLGFFIILGGLFFIVPGILFLVWFSVAPYVLVAENKEGINALFKSRHLASGKWVSVFARVIILAAIVFIVGILAVSFTTFIELSFDAIMDNYNLMLGLENFIYFIVSFFLTPFVFIFGYLLYEDLARLKKNIVFEPTSRIIKIRYSLLFAVGFLFLLLILAIKSIGINIIRIN